MVAYASLGFVDLGTCEDLVVRVGGVVRFAIFTSVFLLLNCLVLLEHVPFRLLCVNPHQYLNIS